jgi:Stress responsive A/B Barrel Domain
MIRHFVALRFKSGVEKAKKQELYDALSKLSAHIKGIVAFQSFENVSVELPLVRGFNDGFWLDLRDESVRDDYLADPVHQAIGGRIVAELEGGVDGVFVCDINI